MINGINGNETTKKNMKLEIVDYAIMKSLTIGNWSTPDMVNLLQIRTLVVEKHIYELTREGFIDFQSRHFVITNKGKNYIFSFEKDNPVNIWKPVEDFIFQTIENRKKERIRFYKTVDFILLISMVILVVLAIYVGIFMR
jgi:hypothetical protein